MFTASAGRMTFEYRYDQSNHSDWIAAEGEIVDDSADDLEKYPEINVFNWKAIEGEASFARWQPDRRDQARRTHPQAPVKDRLWEGLCAILTLMLNVLVTRADGVCVSACAIAFIGGVERSADEKSLGIPQFYHGSVLEGSIRESFSNALDMSGQQVDQRASHRLRISDGRRPAFHRNDFGATPPNSMYYLSKEELELLKVNSEAEILRAVVYRT